MAAICDRVAHPFTLSQHAAPGEMQLAGRIRIERQIPASELVYRLCERSEFSPETPYLNKVGAQGVGDFAIGSKVVLLPETGVRPGVAGSYEWKMHNGDAARGLGSGGDEHGFLLRSQKTFGWFTPIVNLGYTLVPEVHGNTGPESRRDTWKASCAQEWRLSKKAAFLTEVFWKQSDMPGEPYCLAGNAGIRIASKTTWNCASPQGKAFVTIIPEDLTFGCMLEFNGFSAPHVLAKN